MHGSKESFSKCTLPLCVVWSVIELQEMHSHVHGCPCNWAEFRVDVQSRFAGPCWSRYNIWKGDIFLINACVVCYRQTSHEEGLLGTGECPCWGKCQYDKCQWWDIDLSLAEWWRSQQVQYSHCPLATLLLIHDLSVLCHTLLGHLSSKALPTIWYGGGVQVCAFIRAFSCSVRLFVEVSVGIS